MRHVRIVRRLAFVIAVVWAGTAAVPADAASLVVTNATDIANGDVSSPAALRRNHGGDGISLREALLAIDNVAGPHRITFDPALAGRAIRLRQALPHVSRDGVTLTGLTSAGGRPRITIDGRDATNAQQVLLVKASSFTMTGIRFVRVGPAIAFVTVRAGRTWFYGRAPQRVENVRIVHNEFSNLDVTAPFTMAVELATQSARDGRGCANAVIANVVIAHNLFDDFPGNGEWANGILLRAGGDRCRITDVAIHGNTFRRVVIPIELGTNPGARSEIRRTRIVGNVFTKNYLSVTLNPVGDAAPNVDSVIDDTLIERNLFDLNLDTAIALHGGVDAATGNVVSRTRIVNNLIIRGPCALCPVGPGGPFDGVDKGGGVYVADNDAPATGNRVTDVDIVNNTIVRRDSPGPSAISVVSAGGVTGLRVVNTIFWGNAGDDVNGVTADQVRFSLTSQPGFAGVNGNIAGDPTFVSPTTRNYRLASGSPAIDAGTSAGTPARDFDCRRRFDDPSVPNSGAGARPWVDIGAFEFRGTAPDCAVPLTVALTGDGAGTVTTRPLGVACGSACTAKFAFGTDVRLTAMPAAGSVFAGWSGAGCNRTGGCTVRLVSLTTVRARFEPAP